MYFKYIIPVFEFLNINLWLQNDNRFNIRSWNCWNNNQFQRWFVCLDEYATNEMYLRCSSSDDDDDNFALDTCPEGNVIDIQVAQIGMSSYDSDYDDYNYNCDPTTNAFCVRTIISHPEITSCNGQRNCIFTNNILSFPGNDICYGRYEANFVLILYSCRGKYQFNVPKYT